jgi:aldose 1-epimerase
MPIEKITFGRFWDTDVNCYILKSSSGVTVRILDYGAIIQSLDVPGKNDTADVVLGFDTFYDYLKGHPFFGAVAGRVANRIPDGCFYIDGEAFQLGVNAPFDNHLHGGFRGFDKYVWESECFQDGNKMVVRLNRISPDGEEGYPGNLDTTITYTLNNDNVLGFEVNASTDKPTIVNVVQHSYINMAGHNTGDVKEQHLTIEADAVTPTDDRLIPTGDIMDVTGTPFDFREYRVLGQVFEKVEGVFDINYILRPKQNGLKPCARFHDPQSGRTMTMETNAPGVQFYNGCKIYDQNQIGKGGHCYPAWAGICLETQAFPNAVNRENFPSMVVRPGKPYHHKTNYSFSVE